MEKVIQELVQAFPAPYSMNPIFVHGASGKSHLLMAIAHEFKKRGAPILYVRAPTFVRELVTAVRMGEMTRFREFYRAAKALLIDDVHLLQEKFGVQEELFHTFNALHGSHIPLIFAAPGTPATLVGFEPRLLSRFEWGVVLPLPVCDREMCGKILERAKARLGLTLDDQLLLDAFSHPRELLKALHLYVLRGEHNLPSVIEELKGQNEDRSAAIIRMTAAHFGLSLVEVMGKSRERQPTLVRSIAMTLIRREMKLSFPQIGRLFHRTHTSVMRAISDTEKSSNQEIVAALIQLGQKLRI